MKRILIFSLAYYPKYVGGAEVALKEITDRIAGDDIAFDMLTLRFDSTLPREETIGNVRIHRIGWSKTRPNIQELQRFPLYLLKVFYPILAARKAARLDREHRYDAAWAMMSYMGFPIIIWNMLTGRNIPFLLTLQEGDTPEHMGERARIRAVGGLYRSVFAKASFVQTISYYLADWATGMGYKGPLYVVPNAVDVAHFSEEFTETELAELRLELGKKKEDRFIITTSRLVSKNAIDMVIRALKHLPPHVHFLVLGEGPDEGSLKELAEREGVARRVKFLGHIGHDKLPKYLKVSDVFIRPSRSEGMGNSFVEAMAAEVPVIATPVGGIVDFLFDEARNPDREPTGLFVRVDDPEDIAQKVGMVLGRDDLRERIVANAHRMVVEKYDWNLIARTMREKVFAPLLEGKSQILSTKSQTNSNDRNSKSKT